MKDKESDSSYSSVPPDDLEELVSGDDAVIGQALKWSAFAFVSLLVAGFVIYKFLNPGEEKIKPVNTLVEAPEQQEQIRAQISTSLKMVVTQRLLKTKDGLGRAGAFEIMKCTSPIQNLIREAKIHQIPSIMQTAVRDGMITMEKSIQDLVSSGKIDASAAKAEH